MRALSEDSLVRDCEFGLCCAAMRIRSHRLPSRSTRSTKSTVSGVARLLRLSIVLSILPLLITGCPYRDPLDQARELQASGNFAECVAVLREAIADGADDPEVFFLYGKALSATGELDAAVWPLRRAMESSEWEVPAAMQLATSAFMRSSFDRAVKTLDRLLEIKPDNIPALILRSRARIESRRDYEGALADAERVLELDPDAGQAKISLAVALLGLERPEDAAEVLESMDLLSREIGPDQPETARFCGARASFAKEKGDKQAAEELYAGCLKEFPGASILVDDALKFYESQGLADRAIEVLEAAVEAAPEIRDYRVGLAVRLAARGRGEEAEAVLRAATEAKNPILAAGAWLDFGGYLLERGKHSEGIEAYGRALELTPDPSADLLFRYGDALIIADRLDKALEVANRIEVSAHRDLIQGRVYLERGEPARALERFAAGLERWPENAVARYYTAQAAEAVGDYERAVEEFRFSIRAGAGQTDARARLARLHLAEGQPREAYEVLLHNIGREPGDAEMALIGIELIAQLGLPGEGPENLTQSLRSPDDWRRALLAAARGTRTRAGAAAAVQLIQEVPGLDLADPANASLLERLVVDLVDAERTEEAAVLMAGQLQSQPEAGAFHAIYGWLLARRDGVGSEQSREALLRALELEPHNAVALLALGHDRIVAGEPDKALSYFDTAIEGDPDDPAPLRAAIELLLTEGRAGEAEAKLEKLLELDPYDAAAALGLAKLRDERGGEKQRSIALGRLAVRFGTNRNRVEAITLLERLGAEVPRATTR